MRISPLDLPNNQETFFKVINGQVVRTSDIRELVDEKTSLSPLITQIFDVYGSRVPYPFTVFEGIYRIDQRIDSKIFYENGRISLIDDQELVPIKKDWDMSDYYKSLSEAVKCKTKYAAVMLSSGWDSSSILGSLVENMPPENIKAFTLKLEFGLDQPANIFEIKKAKEICAHYGVENIVVKNDFYNDLDNFMKKSSHKMLFCTPALSHQKLWQAIEEYGLKGTETTVYAGEYSDGAHNFGFSQHFGAIYPEKGFRQYGDKIRNYFLSPSFLRRLINEKNIESDFLVKHFSPSKLVKYLGWEEKDLMIDLIRKIFTTDSRGPFITETITREDLKEETINKLNEIILNHINPIDLNYWYSLILRIYKHFHWAGSTVKGIELHNPGGFTVNMPFGNNDFISLLEKMPTEFGRGLEPLPTKYPLKKYCETQLKSYPFELQEGHHAYLYDVDQSVSLINLAYENTSYSEVLKSSWNKDRYGIRRNFLKEEYFLKMNNELNSDDKNVKPITIQHATSTHMLDQFLEYSGYLKK